jgi:hypothetical protein
MIRGTIDRIENEVIVVLTHTEPVQTIHLPFALFPDFDEGDIIEIRVDKNLEIAQELRERGEKVREGLNRVEL